MTKQKTHNKPFTITFNKLNTELVYELFLRFLKLLYSTSLKKYTLIIPNQNCKVLICSRECSRYHTDCY